MIKLSRGALAAIAAVVAIPAGIGIAKTIEHARWNAMTPETRARLDEGRLAMAKTALKLTADQEKLWSPLEAQIRDTFKDRAAKRAEHEKMREERKAERADGKRPDMAERFDKMSQHMTERAERMKSFAGTFKPFYASLSDEQKDVLRPLMRDLSPGMGRHGGHGHRWAQGGGWGHHGGPDGERGGHHRWGGHDEMRDGGQDAPEQRGGAPEGGGAASATPGEKL